MTDLILHHYPLSTYSEKARLAFGLKKLAYRQVITPVAMPKPDLVPLTGVLVAASGREAVIRRRDGRVGDVHVHFPRAGYDVVEA